MSQAVYKRAKSPTPKQIFDLRTRLDMSQQRASEICECGLNTFRDWEQGRTEMQPAIWKWFRHCALAEAELTR